MSRRIVLDTDIGTDVDDALALALALASPELELVAVTTVSGDTPLRARVAARLLALAGRAAVPVHAGCEMPLAAGGGFALGGHEGEGILDGGLDEFSSEPAVEALLRLFRAGDGLELVAIGPLTNIAVALERDPTLARRVARLTLMGGWMRGVTIGGRSLPPSIDYNLCSDAAAAERVLSSGIPIRLVTPDVTVQVWLTEDDVAKLERGASPLQRALGRALRIWEPHQRHLFAGLGTPLAPDMAAFLHDPLTLACAYDESFCRIEELAIEPVTVDGVFRTLERTPGAAGTFPMRCATAVDAARFTAQMRHRLGLAS
jgi:purine nucleosidase